VESGTVYILAKGEVEYDRCPGDLDRLRNAIVDRTLLGDITDENKNEWLVYAQDFPSGEKRPLTTAEKAELFP
jgi:hypothetical protein